MDSAVCYVGGSDHQITRAVLHFSLHSILGSEPHGEDGQYVLDNHGRTVKALTQLKYFKLKAAELRMFAAGWIFFYFVPTMYWWFPRGRQVSMLPAAQ
jgi:hypothetical protein